MKISEFCKLYGISPQAVYAKIKRCESKPDNILDGHIKKIKGKSMEIDDFAAEYLRPKPANCDELYLEIEKLRELICARDTKIKSLDERLAELEKRFPNRVSSVSSTTQHTPADKQTTISFQQKYQD